MLALLSSSGHTFTTVTMETPGGGGLQQPGETKLQRQQKGTLTKRGTGRRLCLFAQSGGRVGEHMQNTHEHARLCIPLELGS